jgi:hypothetical protein
MEARSRAERPVNSNSGLRGKSQEEQAAVTGLAGYSLGIISLLYSQHLV